MSEDEQQVAVLLVLFVKQTNKQITSNEMALHPLWQLNDGSFLMEFV
jgi:hypothetical protein